MIAPDLPGFPLLLGSDQELLALSAENWLSDWPVEAMAAMSKGAIIIEEELEKAVAEHIAEENRRQESADQAKEWRYSTKLRKWTWTQKNQAEATAILDAA